MSTMLRVLIIEDQPLVATATSVLLQDQFPGVNTTIVDSAAVAIEQAAAGDWFRIFVEPAVAGARDLSLLRGLSESGVIHRCCVITALKDDRLAAEARRLGVLGYVEKGWSVARFCGSLNDIMEGRSVFPATSTREDSKVPQLTSRQLAVLRLLHQGLSSKQVAKELRISVGTVKNHSLALRRALRASNRAHAVARGLEYGLLHPSDLERSGVNS